MGSRTVSVAVVLFWFAMMTWLVVAKVVPQLRRGNPPNFLAVQRKQMDEPAAGWQMLLSNDKQGTDDKLGWAVSKIVSRPDETAELRSRIQFTGLPLHHPLLRALSRAVQLPAAAESELAGRMDSRISLDSRGHVQGFKSWIFLGRAAQPLMEIDGEVQGNELHSVLRSPYLDQPKNWSIPIGEDALGDDGIAPCGYMPPLTLHQSWRVRQYNPLASPSTQLGSSDVVQATVERQEAILWDGDRASHQENCWLVAYRRDAGSGSKSAEQTLVRMWVRVDDGMVLKREVELLGVRLKFVRLSAARTLEVAGHGAFKWLDRLGADPPADVERESATVRPVARPRIAP